MGESSVERTSKTYDNIGYIMSTHYEIIGLCLNNLPNDTLVSVTTVCKAWHHVVQSLLKKRTKLRCHLMIDKSYRKSRKDKQHIYIQHIFQLMKPVIGTEASLCIAFGTKHLYSKIPSSFITLAGTAQQDIYDALQDALPPRCGCVLAYSEGIMGSNNEKDNIIEVAHLPSRAAFAAITLPKIPRVTTHVFRIDQDESVTRGLPQFKFEIFKDGEYHTVTKLSKELLHGTVKCVLLFSDHMVSYREMSTPQKLFSLIKEGQSENFAFGGCVVTSTWVPKTELMAGGVLFCGDNLLAASVVIREADTDDSSIEERMLELKSCNFPLKNSMGLMFSCVGRPDLVSETRCFQRHFPNTPLIGLVGNGEMGWTFLPKLGDQQASGSVPKRRAPNLEHYYSTVVVLLSWDDS